jgi:hypothetical protein
VEGDAGAEGERVLEAVVGDLPAVGQVGLQLAAEPVADHGAVDELLDRAGRRATVDVGVEVRRIGGEAESQVAAWLGVALQRRRHPLSGEERQASRGGHGAAADAEQPAAGQEPPRRAVRSFRPGAWCSSCVPLVSRIADPSDANVGAAKKIALPVPPPCAGEGSRRGSGQHGLALVGGRAAVSEGRQLRPDAAEVAEVEVGDDDRLAVGRIGEHRPPRVDDQGVAVAAGVVRFVRPDLGRGEDEALVLDGARPQQQVPVVLAGVEGEGSGDEEDLRPIEGEQAVELGESGGRSRC